MAVALILTFHDLTYWPPLVWSCTEENTPTPSMLPSLTFWYIPPLFLPLIKRRLFYSEFLTQILYISSLPLFPIYFTNPCCQPFFPNLYSQLLSPTSLSYPCSQFILPTPVVNLCSLTSVPNCCPLPLSVVPYVSSLPQFPIYFTNLRCQP